MSVSFSVDIEAGVSEQDIQGATPDTFHVGATGRQRDLSPGISESVGPGAGPRFDDASEKTHNLYSTNPGEQQTDVVLEGWNGSAKSILLFSGLFSMTVSLFVIESYKKLSPDAADQAVALFDQVSHLVGIPAGPSLEPSPSSPPLELVRAFFEPSSSIDRATTLWLLSLSLNITCVLWILWQQWWRQSTDPYTQGGEPYARARVRAGHSSRVGSLAMGRMVEVIWVLLRASTLLFLVGLGDIILPINTTVPWVLLGYLSILAFLYAARMLIAYRFPIPGPRLPQPLPQFGVEVTADVIPR